MIRCDRLKSESGTTLIEVLTAVGLFAILAAALAVANLSFLKGGREVKARTIRDQIVSQVRMTATDKKAIVESIGRPENAAFKNCFCGINSCTNLKQPLEDFTLYDSAKLKQSPVYYNGEGTFCDPTKSQCPIRVRTQFYAQCMPDLAGGTQDPPTQCNGKPAEYVAILYTIDENPDIPPSKDSLQLRSITGPVYVPVSDIFSEACP